jgi:hypothetical protein
VRVRTNLAALKTAFSAEQEGWTRKLVERAARKRGEEFESRLRAGKTSGPA